jgi:hypothetical protein
MFDSGIRCTIVHIPGRFEPTDRDRWVNRTVIGVANPIPGVPEASQLRIALGAKDQDGIHDEVDWRLLRPSQKCIVIFRDVDYKRSNIKMDSQLSVNFHQCLVTLSAELVMRRDRRDFSCQRA